MPDNFYDSIISDPPYGLGFMGKDWDTFTDAHAEFQARFTVWAKEVLRVAKPGAIALVFGDTRTFHRLTCALEDAGWQIRDCMMWLYGSGFPKGHNISRQYQIQRHGWRGKCISNFAMGRDSFEQRLDRWRLEKKWKGHNVALKPGWEPIVVAMKPIEGTFAENAEKWGVAGLWIDGGRIGTSGMRPKIVSKTGGAKACYGDGLNNSYQDPQGTSQGRWPANVILDEEAGAMLDEQSGVNGSRQTIKLSRKRKGFMLSGSEDNVQEANAPDQYGDTGGASRFFYCAKASKRERNMGCEGLEAAPIKGRDTGQDKLDVPYKQRPTPVHNHHPTVKPLALMEYLCNLTKTPTGGIVLDPFGGSGTTAMACVKTGRQYVLIEKDPEYCEIARLRTQTVKELDKGQKVLF